MSECSLAEPCHRARCHQCYPVENDRAAWSIRRHRTEHSDEWVILRDDRWIATAGNQRDAEFILRAFVVTQMADEYDYFATLARPPRRSPELTDAMVRVAMANEAEKVVAAVPRLDK